MISLRSFGSLLKHQWSRRARPLATGASEPPEFRDVFVMDPSFKLKKWILLPKHRSASGYRSIIHPSCKHVIATYGQYFYSNVKYNYNDLGEFSLNLIATEFINNDGRSDYGSKSSNNSSTHSLLLWPEGVFLEGLQRSDIPIVGDYLLNKNTCLTDLHKLQLSAGCKISPLSKNQLIAISQISSSQSAVQALQTIQHFTNASATSPNLQQRLSCGIGVQLSARHRSGANVLILSGSVAEGGDGFEAIWSEAQAKKILESYQL